MVGRGSPSVWLTSNTDTTLKAGICTVFSSVSGLPSLSRIGLPCSSSFSIFCLTLYGAGARILMPFSPFFTVRWNVSLPLVEARHQLPALHGDQQGVVEAVIVEFRHRGEVGFVAVAVEQLLNPCFQPVRNFFHSFRAVFAVQDDGENLSAAAAQLCIGGGMLAASRRISGTGKDSTRYSSGTGWPSWTFCHSSPLLTR